MNTDDPFSALHMDYDFWCLSPFLDNSVDVWEFGAQIYLYHVVQA